MDSYTRIMTAWAHEEADRVPIELEISPAAREYPEAGRIVDFIDHEADNFVWLPGVDWGLFGLPCTMKEEVIEDCPGEFKRIRRIASTPAGEFQAITKHMTDELNPQDFHWERRWIDALEDMHRLAEAPRGEIPIDKSAFDAAVAVCGRRGVPLLGVHHPLGALVRGANMEEVYLWLAGEKELMHRFLQSSNEQVAAACDAMGRLGMGPVFGVTAHEMLIPPWVGMSMFDEFVFPYDKLVNDAIHRHGGRVRAHCHGNCMDYLEKMCDMGIDSVEPLEPSPYGNVDLAEAKRRVGDRMLLSGNVCSQDFLRMSTQDVRDAVAGAIDAAAAGGGFTLRTTGGHAGTNSTKTREQMLAFFDRIETYIDAALELGDRRDSC